MAGIFSYDLLVVCDICDNEFPDRKVFIRGQNPDIWWENLFTQDANRVCYLCMDHRVCYPFYELRLNDITNEQRTFLEKEKHICCYPNNW